MQANLNLIFIKVFEEIANLAGNLKKLKAAGIHRIC